MTANIRRVRYMPGYISPRFITDDGYISSKDGLYPDLLEPFDMDALPLIPGTWQSL